MTTIPIDLPENIFSTLRKYPQEFTQEFRLLATIKWYELGKITQGQAAEIAGLNRIEFIDCLSHYQVSPFQYTPDEIEADLQGIYKSNH
jgi:predicted HTH domain antitoxin